MTPKASAAAAAPSTWVDPAGISETVPHSNSMIIGRIRALICKISPKWSFYLPSC